MLISEPVLQALLDAGIIIVAEEAVDDGRRRVDVRLSVPSNPQSSARILNLEIKQYGRPIGPRVLDDLSARRSGDGGVLVICPTASPAVRERAVQLGISVIAENSESAAGPDGHLVIGPTEIVPLGRRVSNPDGAAGLERRDRRLAWSEWAVLRTVLLGAAATQAEIAGQAGVSQPRVSQLLTKLGRQGFVERRPGEGWTALDRDRAIRHWVDGYPGPGGVTTYWYGLESPIRQSLDVVRLLQAAETARPGRVLISGPVAADAVAAWARPQLAIVYARQGADLSVTGLTPSAPDLATIQLVVPEDASVWSHPDRAWRRAGQDPAPGGLPLADPLQVLHDVRRSGTSDADQSADRLHRLLAS